MYADKHGDEMEALITSELQQRCLEHPAAQQPSSSLGRRVADVLLGVESHAPAKPCTHEYPLLHPVDGHMDLSCAHGHQVQGILPRGPPAPGGVSTPGGTMPAGPLGVASQEAGDDCSANAAVS